MAVRVAGGGEGEGEGAARGERWAGREGEKAGWHGLGWGARRGREEWGGVGWWSWVGGGKAAVGLMGVHTGRWDEDCFGARYHRMVRAFVCAWTS